MQAQTFSGPVLFVKRISDISEIPVDSAGYQAIVNGTALTGPTALTGLALEAHDLSITIDGVAVATAVTPTAATVAGVIAGITTAIGAAGTCALVNGAIRITSATTGYESSVAIVDGGEAGDLIFDINALSLEGIELSIGTAVAGVEGGFVVDLIDVPPTDYDAIFIAQVRSSEGLIKGLYVMTFNKTTGRLSIQDNTADVAVGDTITVLATFGTIS